MFDIERKMTIWHGEGFCLSVALARHRLQLYSKLYTEVCIILEWSHIFLWIGLAILVEFLLTKLSKVRKTSTRYFLSNSERKVQHYSEGRRAAQWVRCSLRRESPWKWNGIFRSKRVGAENTVKIKRWLLSTLPEEGYFLEASWPSRE